jgi:hypothetical protein
VINVMNTQNWSTIPVIFATVFFGIGCVQPCKCDHGTNLVSRRNILVEIWVYPSYENPGRPFQLRGTPLVVRFPDRELPAV